MLNTFTEYFAGFTTGAIALRLLFAAVLGCIIGLERATKHHPAGMRTFALVCLGAAASAIVNIYLGTAFGTGRTDLSRIPAGVVSGIGFLGVGTIIITGKNQVRGLTTAAGLWTTATLGIMLGSGMLQISLILFVLIFSTMFGIARPGTTAFYGIADLLACNDSYAVYPPLAFPCVAYECIGNNTVTFFEQESEFLVLFYADVFLCILIH